MQTDQHTILNSSIISSIESKTNSLFRSIIDDLEEYIDSSSSSIELVYDTMIKIDTCIKAIISNAKSTEMSKKELISLYEDKIKEQMNTITFYKTENQKFIDREKSMMKFEKDLFDSKEFRDQDLKYILFQAKRELKEIKTDYKNKELKYLCTIGNQMSQIKSLKQNIEELNTYIENHVTQAEKAKNKKSSLFPHLYRRFEREEINANNKKKKQQPKLYGTRIGRNENKMNLLKQLFKRMDTNMDTYLTEGNTNEHKKGTKYNNYIKKSHFNISHERCLTSPNTFK